MEPPGKEDVVTLARRITAMKDEIRMLLHKTEQLGDVEAQKKIPRTTVPLIIFENTEQENLSKAATKAIPNTIGGTPKRARNSKETAPSE